jgi:transcriptional regulator with XRE-family HTH domain
MNVNGKNLRKARQAAGLTQADLAEQVGMGAGTIANMETGRHGTSFPVLSLIAQVLNVDTARLER